MVGLGARARSRTREVVVRLGRVSEAVVELQLRKLW